MLTGRESGKREGKAGEIFLRNEMKILKKKKKKKKKKNKKNKIKR